MIDARKWTRPAPDDVRAAIEATGLTQTEVGRRVGCGARRVRHWVAEDAIDGRRITYAEWMLLLRLPKPGAPA